MLSRDVLGFFGAHDLTNYLETGRLSLSPKEIIVHSEWNPATTEYDSDLSLLQFDYQSIIFNEFVQPICLWNFQIEPSETEGEVVGWGKSEDQTRKYEDVPKVVKALIQTNEQCFLDEKALVKLSSLQTFCAGLRNGSGVCNGDSGGGLFIKNNGVSYLKGIVSSSLVKDGGCDVARNAVYTNVPKFGDWIGKMIGISLPDAGSKQQGIIIRGGVTIVRGDPDPMSPSGTRLPISGKRSNSMTKAEFKTEFLFADGKVYCTFTTHRAGWHDYKGTCIIKSAIDREDSVLVSPVNTTVDEFSIKHNKQVKFLPQFIGEIFPNLKNVEVWGCGLTIIRNFYFKNMLRVTKLRLRQNKIATIESEAFRDLVSVESLDLDLNLIETLDGNLFVTMLKLDTISLVDNKIKFLSPTIFRIPDGVLKTVNLQYNECIHGYYFNLNQLEYDLRANCSQVSTISSPKLSNVQSPLLSPVLRPWSPWYY